MGFGFLFLACGFFFSGVGAACGVRLEDAGSFGLKAVSLHRFALRAGEPCLIAEKRACVRSRWRPRDVFASAEDSQDLAIDAGGLVLRVAPVALAAALVFLVALSGVLAAGAVTVALADFVGGGLLGGVARFSQFGPRFNGRQRSGELGSSGFPPRLVGLQWLCAMDCGPES